MIFTFVDAYALVAVGSAVRVSDGTLEPTDTSSAAWRAWRSHNCEGTLVGKKPGPPQALVVQLPEIDGASISYEISDPAGTHTIEEIEPPDEKKLAASLVGRRKRAGDRGRLVRGRPAEIVARLESTMRDALNALFEARGLKPITAAEEAKLFPHIEEGR